MVRFSNHAGKGLSAMHRRHDRGDYLSPIKHALGQRTWFESLTMTSFFVIPSLESKTRNDACLL
jgi:hypothetical protein